MTIAHDAFAENSGGNTGNFSWTHTPSGTPRGVLVYIRQSTTAADEISGVTYGGVSMTRIVSVDATGISDQPGRLFVYRLFSSVPAGAQTVSVTTSGATSTKVGYSVTQTTASVDVALEDAQSDVGSFTTDPTVTLTIDEPSLVYCFGLNGARPTLISPLAGWTGLAETDWGNSSTFTYVYDTVGSSNVDAGPDTGGNEDYAIIGVALKEAAGGGGGAIEVLMGQIVL